LVDLIALTVLTCKKAAFDIDPAKVYSPAKLVEKTQGKCKNSYPWDGKQVTTSGLISRPSEGIFLLLDEQNRTPLTVRVAIKNAQELAQTTAYLQANVSKKVTITGTATSEIIATQFKCRTSISIRIDNQNAIKL
jgi:hypothetical protein